jgi:hypothetical protein
VLLRSFWMRSNYGSTGIMVMLLQWVVWLRAWRTVVDYQKTCRSIYRPTDCDG